MNKRRLLQLISWLAMWLFMWWVGIKNIDTDFGWHLKTGEMILKSGFPRNDPFSYTMPSYYYVDHAWLTDVIWAAVYPVVGLTGLAAGMALLTLTAFLVVNPKQTWKWIDMPIWLGLAVMVHRYGVRTQVIDWWMWGLLFGLLRNRERWLRWRVWVPVIMCVWANMHGGFAVGLGLMAWVLAWHAVHNKRADIKDILVWISSIAVSLINPYGVELWREIRMTIWGNNMQQTIVEWQPYIMGMDYEYMIMAGAAGALIIRFWKRISKMEVSVLAITFLAGLSSQRHLPLFMVAATPLVTEQIDNMRMVIKKDRIATTRAAIFYKLLLGVVGVFAALDLGNVLWRTISNPPETGFYPVKAVQFIKQNNFSGQIFSSYGWGGYLIWNIPEKKTFIDGRMAIWKRDTAPDNESKNAFEDYLKISGEGQIHPYFEKYDIETILWPTVKTSELGNLLAGWIEKFSGKNNTNDKTNLEATLVKEKWTKVYSDETAVVYRKPMN